MSVAVDMTIQHRDGRRGRLIAVRSEPSVIGLSTLPLAWAILVVVDGAFEEWRAIDCRTAPPAAAPVPPTRGKDVYRCTCSNGCQATGCDRL